MLRWQNIVYLSTISCCYDDNEEEDDDRDYWAFILTLANFELQSTCVFTLT